MLPVLAIICCIALGMLITYGFFPVKKWVFRRIPGPRPLWLIGNLPEMVAHGQQEAYRKWALKYGSTFRVWMGAFPVIVTEDPAAAHKLTSKCHARHPVPFIEVGEDEKLNNLSIAFVRGDLWKSFRFAWQPMFHSGSLQGFVALMRDKAQRLVQVMEAAALAGEEVDIVRTFNEMTMEVVGESAYGVDFKILFKPHSSGDANLHCGGSLEEETRQLVTAMRAFFNGTAQMGAGAVTLMMMFPGCAPFIKWVANTFPTKQYAALLEARALIRDVSARLLQLAKEGKAKPSGQAAAPAITNASKEPGAVDVKSEDKGRKGVAPGSFIHLLMNSKNKVTGQPFSDFDIIANSFFFMISGNETTSTTLTLAVYLLSRNLDKEAKVIQEVDAFGRQKTPTYDDLHQFPYIDAVIKETLRLYPPVHILTREADKAMQVGPYDVPAGTPLQVSVYGMHRNPAHWGKPESFMPERFLPGGDGVNNVAFMPFGDGPRSCIGSGYAMQELEITLIALYQRFQIRLTSKARAEPEPEMRTSITLGPEGPIMVNVGLRK